MLLEPTETEPPGDDAIAREARFWDARQTSDEPDHRLRRRTASPQELWEDPEIEAIARGRYVDRILDGCGTERLDVLELACGCGWLALELARRGHTVHAIDISPERIRSAAEYAALLPGRGERLGRLTHEIADLNTIDLPPRAYDRIVCWDGLHHVEEIARLVGQAHESLRPGGRLIVFDHVGPRNAAQRRADEALALLAVLLCQPAHLASILRGRRHVERAPSEGVTGKEMIHRIEETFGAQHVRVETVLSLGKRWLARLRGPRALRLGFARAFCAVDRAAIRSRLARGEYVYIEAGRAPRG